MGTKWIQVKNYCMKCRLYPSEKQKTQIEALLRGTQAAYNMTLYKIKAEKRFTREKPNKDGDGVIHFPDFNAAFAKSALDELRHDNEFVNYVPGEALSSSVHGLASDMKKSWEKTGRLPVEMWGKKYGPSFYNQKRPRTSFCYTTSPKNIQVTDNAGVVKIKVYSRNYAVDGMIKARGVNQRIRFSDDLTQTFQGWISSGNVSKLPIRIEKSLDQYYVVFMLRDIYKPYTVSEERKVHVGIDVGEITLASLSNGRKYESIFDANRYFEHNTRSIEELNKILSRKQGWKNIAFREAHKKNTELTPSKAYLEADRRYKQLSARRTNRKNTYYHMVVSDICANYEGIAVEGLSVKDMYWYKEKAEDAEKENEPPKSNP